MRTYTATNTSFNQLFHIAAIARSKLDRDTKEVKHDIRRLVAHASLLDGLMERMWQWTIDPSHDIRWKDALEDFDDDEYDSDNDGEDISCLIEEEYSPGNDNDDDEVEDEAEWPLESGLTLTRCHAHMVAVRPAQDRAKNAERPIREQAGTQRLLRPTP